MGAGCSTVSDDTLEDDALVTADICESKGAAARSLGAIDLALDCYTESLRLRASVKWAREGNGARRKSRTFLVASTYTESYSRILIVLGQLYFSIEREVESFIYYLHAYHSLNPLMRSLCGAPTTAIDLYAQISVGLTLVYLSVAEQRAVPTERHPLTTTSPQRRSSSINRASRGGDDGYSTTICDFLETNCDPILMAELQLEKALEYVVKGDERRSSIHTTVLHVKARIDIVRWKYQSALRSAQWCLGVTLNSKRVADVEAVLTISRNIVAILKCRLKEQNAARAIQSCWWRWRRRVAAVAATTVNFVNGREEPSHHSPPTNEQMGSIVEPPVASERRSSIGGGLIRTRHVEEERGGGVAFCRSGSSIVAASLHDVGRSRSNINLGQIRRDDDDDDDGGGADSNGVDSPPFTDYSEPITPLVADDSNRENDEKVLPSRSSDVYAAVKYSVPIPRSQRGALKGSSSSSDLGEEKISSYRSGGSLRRLSNITTTSSGGGDVRPVDHYVTTKSGLVHHHAIKETEEAKKVEKQSVKQESIRSRDEDEEEEEEEEEYGSEEEEEEEEAKMMDDTPPKKRSGGVTLISPHITPIRRRNSSQPSVTAVLQRVFRKWCDEEAAAKRRRSTVRGPPSPGGTPAAADGSADGSAAGLCTVQSTTLTLARHGLQQVSVREALISARMMLRNISTDANNSKSSATGPVTMKRQTTAEVLGGEEEEECDDIEEDEETTPLGGSSMCGRKKKNGLTEGRSAYARRRVQLLGEGTRLGVLRFLWEE